MCRIVTGNNRILHNHAVASKNYGMWFRPERSATGTSENTPMDVSPNNIPMLEWEGNECHSNGKYGLRMFDIYTPIRPCVMKSQFVWRNKKIGWTATVIGDVGFVDFVAVQNGVHDYESRQTTNRGWGHHYISGGLFVDWTGLPLTDNFYVQAVLGTPAFISLHLPFTDGLIVKGCTFVNYAHPCIRGCAHCGRPGSPPIGCCGAQTRFGDVHFHNSSQRVMFRTPFEAWFYDLDGSLTDTGIKEDYTYGPTGLHWEEIGDAGVTGRELVNSGLAEKLITTTTLTDEEWDSFGIKDLQTYHYIKSGNSIFRPADGRIIGYASICACLCAHAYMHCACPVLHHVATRASTVRACIACRDKSISDVRARMQGYFGRALEVASTDGPMLYNRRSRPARWSLRMLRQREPLRRRDTLQRLCQCNVPAGVCKRK